MQIICIYQKYFVILHRFFGSEPKTNPKSNPKKNNEIMKKFNVEINGKIYGQTDDFESAKTFARNLGANAIVFCGGVVAFPI